MVHPGGRPRTSTPPTEECCRLGEEMVKWFTKKDTKELRFRFAQWYSEQKHMLRKDWKNLVLLPEFKPYYENVQSILTIKCLDGTVKEGFGQRYLRLYDRELVEEENKEAKFQADLKSKETITTSVDDLKRYSDFMAYLQLMKEDYSSLALNKEDSKNNTESKS